MFQANVSGRARLRKLNQSLERCTSVMLLLLACDNREVRPGPVRSLIHLFVQSIIDDVFKIIT